MIEGWTALALAIAAELAGTSALKASDGFTRLLPSLVTVVGYGAAFPLLARALRTVPLGVAYAVWSGVGIVAIAAVGALAFGQRLGAGPLAGIALIIAGVVVLQLTTAPPHGAGP